MNDFPMTIARSATQDSCSIRSILMHGSDPEFNLAVGTLLGHEFRIFLSTYGEALPAFLDALEPELLILEASPSTHLARELERIRVLKPRLRIILILGSPAGNRALAKDIAASADLVLLKPACAAELLRRIRALSAEAALRVGSLS